MRNTLVVLAALALLAGCDREDIKQHAVVQGRAAVQDAQNVVNQTNAQTVDPTANARKIDQAIDLINTNQLDAARTLLSEADAQKDVLPDATKAKLEEAHRQLDAKSH